MMNILELEKAYNSITGWMLVTFFSVGGFEWLGFSKINPHQMICISSQKTTMVDCDTGKITECNIDYDEESLTAICDLLPNELISLSGQYAGKLPVYTQKGESIIINQTQQYIQKITFITNTNCKTDIYWNYGYYTCGFSYDGNYFVLASDGSIAIMKRNI